MDLLKWSKRPAADVEARKPEVNILRGLIARATTPLLPDDYLHLINPLWSARELRGRCHLYTTPIPRDEAYYLVCPLLLG